MKQIQLDAEDESKSETVTIVLPEKRVGTIHKVSCCHVLGDELSGNGSVKVEWSLFHSSEQKSPSALGVLSYEVVWSERIPEHDREEIPVREQRIKVENHENYVMLPVTKMG